VNNSSIGIAMVVVDLSTVGSDMTTSTDGPGPGDPRSARRPGKESNEKT
jgi:hypothetical protein